MIRRYQVEVFVEDMLIDLQSFFQESAAQDFADTMQDEGFKVRFKQVVV